MLNLPLITPPRTIPAKRKEITSLVAKHKISVTIARKVDQSPKSFVVSLKRIRFVFCLR